eukprot:EG_transcript_32861
MPALLDLAVRPQIFVAPVPDTCTMERLHHTFSTFGAVTELTLKEGKALVSFGEFNSCEDAIEAFAHTHVSVRYSDMDTDIRSVQNGSTFVAANRPRGRSPVWSEGSSPSPPRPPAAPARCVVISDGEEEESGNRRRPSRLSQQRSHASDREELADRRSRRLVLLGNAEPHSTTG